VTSKQFGELSAHPLPPPGEYAGKKTEDYTDTMTGRVHEGKVHVLKGMPPSDQTKRKSKHRKRFL
jgi:hypothetical protein